MFAKMLHLTCTLRIVYNRSHDWGLSYSLSVANAFGTRLCGVRRGSRKTMKLSRSMLYGISALVQLSRSEPGVPISGRVLAKDDDLPPRFLLQILRRMVRHNLLCSTRGIEGGYYLSRPAAEISLNDIFAAVEEKAELSLPDVNGMSVAKNPRLRAALKSATDVIRRELHKVTIADLVKAEDS